MLEIGNKVRIKKLNLSFSSCYEQDLHLKCQLIGQVGTVLKVFPCSRRLFLLSIENKVCNLLWDESELEIFKDTLPYVEAVKFFIDNFNTTILISLFSGRVIESLEDLCLYITPEELWGEWKVLSSAERDLKFLASLHKEWGK